jgi:hypothetical protein
MEKRIQFNRDKAIQLINSGDQRNKPQSIILNDIGENIINYSGNRPSEKLTFDEAVRLHKIYPDVLVIQFKNENSPDVLSNPVIISWRHD